MGVAIALSVVVHKYGEVLSARTEDGSTLRDGPPGLLRVSGFLLWHMLRTTASLRETGMEAARALSPDRREHDYSQ
jgi:hypothetical protein